MSRYSQKIGKRFEQTIAKSARDRKDVVLLKIEAAKVGEKYTKSVWVDYVGWIDGRAFTFDAKWIGEATHFNISSLTRKQRGYLGRGHESGAYSFAMVGYVRAGKPRVAVLPFEVLPERGSVELVSYEVQDWLLHVGDVTEQMHTESLCYAR